MIELHYWTTPNGHKIATFLEESGVPYRIVPVNISIGEQFKPNFLKISPNNRIPAIAQGQRANEGDLNSAQHDRSLCRAVSRNKDRKLVNLREQ